MHKKEEFKDLTMCEEIAYSIACLEKLCVEWNVKSKAIAACIEIFWGFTKKDISYWEDDIYNIKYNFKDIECYELDNFDEDKKKTIANIIDNITKISLGNLYTRYIYTNVIQDILDIEKLLEENKVECPDLNYYRGKDTLIKADLYKLRDNRYNLVNIVSFRDK